jgi:hypothetical protein
LVFLGPLTGLVATPSLLVALRDDVQRQRHLHFLRRRPERIVELAIVGLVLRRHSPDHRAFESQLCASPQLGDGKRDIIK